MEQLAPFELSMLARTKGFDLRTLYSFTSPGDQEDYIYETLDNGWTIGSYVEKGWVSDLNYNDLEDEEDDFQVISAPTLEQIQKWLRDKHQIYVLVGRADQPYLSFECNYTTEIYDTYEEALVDGLTNALKTLDNG